MTPPRKTGRQLRARVIKLGHGHYRLVWDGPPRKGKRGRPPKPQDPDTEPPDSEPVQGDPGPLLRNHIRQRSETDGSTDP
jgi:hypothetical protein